MEQEEPSTGATLALTPLTRTVQRGKDAPVAASSKMTAAHEGLRPRHKQTQRQMARSSCGWRNLATKRLNLQHTGDGRRGFVTAELEILSSILEPLGAPLMDNCNHTSFNYKFCRYQYLRPVAILYIALVIILANGRDATFTCVVNNLGGYRVSGEATPARISKRSLALPLINTTILHTLFGADVDNVMQVAWIKADAKAILAIHEHVITNNGRLSVTHNDYNTWTLVIRNVKMEDRGVYMCQVNTDPMKMQTAFLEVVIPPDIIYEETSGDMMVPEGGSAKLICKARGYPKPKIVWRREDGREIIARNGTHGKMKGSATIVEGEMLSLTKVTRSEMGAYMCIASNGVPPSVSKRLKLQVHLKSDSMRCPDGQANVSAANR
uniref:Ig-like domain-containing protein n=1 Tax=Anopheles culicifacies TaxID=139723 RepID=A0A182MII5_9DIPT